MPRSSTASTSDFPRKIDGLCHDRRSSEIVHAANELNYKAQGHLNIPCLIFGNILNLELAVIERCQMCLQGKRLTKKKIIYFKLRKMPHQQ